MNFPQQQHAHIPFAQLSIADRFLYWICANVAIGLLRPCSHMTKEIGEDIIWIWDEQKFAPGDLLDGVSMADRLKPHLAKNAVTDPRAWFPDRTARKRRKTEN